MVVESDRLWLSFSLALAKPNKSTKPLPDIIQLIEQSMVHALPFPSSVSCAVCMGEPVTHLPTYGSGNSIDNFEGKVKLIAMLGWYQ